MIIKRVLNHNAVIAQNNKNVDILLFGKGIAFGKKVGDAIPPSSIEKSFLLKNSDNMNRFTELFIDVPIELVYVCEKIINLGKITLGNHFDEIIYINLTDHINSSIERHKEGVVVTNPLRWEIAKYYKEEFELGKKALSIIKKIYMSNSQLMKQPSSLCILSMRIWKIFFKNLIVLLELS
ncbi:TPA: PRD domain-containing protein [Streptococcus suis]|nr:PRD domain-containing protein [Streptococcus suis]HEM5285572.1 PRD domain-containing protein [Streptococcus suis]